MIAHSPVSSDPVSSDHERERKRLRQRLLNYILENQRLRAQQRGAAPTPELRPLHETIATPQLAVPPLGIVAAQEAG